MDLESLKYPIGRFKRPTEFTNEQIDAWIKVIEDFPSALKNEVENLNDAQLDTPYRPGGWTLRQLVHHCADSHINSYTRLKLALTEENPAIKPYKEDLWAELHDSDLPIASSLKILEGLHHRWCILLHSLTERDLEKTFYHPETEKQTTLKTYIALYAWHCTHHLAHITQLKQNQNWV